MNLKRPLLACVLAFAFVRAAAASPTPHVLIDQGLQSLEAGQPVPVGYRPRPERRSVGVGAAEPQVTPAAYTEPTEFQVLLEFEGSRAQLEAAGVRVQSQAGRYFTALMRRDEIGKLRYVSGLLSARLSRYQEPQLNLSIPDCRADLEHGVGVGSPPVYPGFTGKGIILGDVDTGIDFTSADFTDGAGKTRILYIWDQTDALGPNPSGFAYGSEWTKSNIDNTPGAIREVDSNGHGTNVCGVLAGTGATTGCSKPAYRFVGMCPDANLIQVKTDFSDAGIIDGVNYVMQKAAALGMDCVVNLSLGSQFGPHDGSDAFSTAIGALAGPGHIVVASAGNNQADGIHAKVITTSTTVGTDRFTVNVPTYTANAGTFSDYFLVTGWYDPSVSMTIRVKGPNAADTLSVGFNNTADRDLVVASGKGGRIFIANNNATYGYSGTAKGRQFEVEVYDTLASSPPRSGTWEVDVVTNNGSALGKRVDAWIYVSILGNKVATVGTGLDATTLVGEPADADSVLAVAAHATKANWPSCSAGGTCGYTVPPTLGQIASFSSTGPRRDGVLKPEISAPGFGVATTHSSQSPALAVCSDADDSVHQVTQGTSFSSPHVSGAVGIFLQAHKHANPTFAKMVFEQHARVDAFVTGWGAAPNSVFGYGKLDVYAVMDHTPPTCAVTSPVSHPSWAIGSSHNVTWTATDSVGVDSVKIEYSSDGGSTWTTLATLTNTGTYPWTVTAPTTTKGLFRVTARDAGLNSTAAYSDTFNVTSAVAVGGGARPIFALGRSQPNPSHGTTSIAYSLAKDGPAALSIYTTDGRRVAVLANGKQSAGWHLVTWDAQRAASGVYYYRLEAGDQKAVRKLVLTR